MQRIANAAQDFKCFCGGAHGLVHCKKFKKFPHHLRVRKVVAAQLCFNCFAHTHSLGTCTSNNRCRTCGEKHHTMLHDESSGTVSRGSRVPNLRRNTRRQTLQSTSSRASLMPLVSHGQLILLPTVRCNIVYGSRRLCIRALVDATSPSTLISINVLRSAKIPRRVGDLVDVILSSMHDDRTRVTAEATVVAQLNRATPSAAIPHTLQERVGFLKLADETFGVPGPIDMILGVEVYSEILKPGVIKQVGCPLAQECKFGYLLSGKFN